MQLLLLSSRFDARRAKRMSESAEDLAGQEGQTFYRWKKSELGMPDRAERTISLLFGSEVEVGLARRDRNAKLICRSLTERRHQASRSFGSED